MAHLMRGGFQREEVYYQPHLIPYVFQIFELQ